MTPAEAEQKATRLRLLLETPGWREDLVPAFQKQIDALTDAILKSGINEITDPILTTQKRREREFLKSLIDLPDRLLRDISAGIQAGR